MTRRIELTIIAPVFNGAITIKEYILRTVNTLKVLSISYQIILIDDGSTDNSLSIMRKLQREYPGIMIIKLTRNYGQSNAIAAGFTKAEGNFIVVMDSDLQDKPEDIILLYSTIRKGSVDMIIARRQKTNRSTWRNLCSFTFDILTILCTRLKFPFNSGVFRIMKMKCFDHLNKALHTPGTVLSCIHASGYTWKTVNLSRDKSNINRSSYTLRKMIQLASYRILPYTRLSRQLLGEDFLLRYIPRFQIDEIYTGQENE